MIKTLAGRGLAIALLAATGVAQSPNAQTVNIKTAEHYRWPTGKDACCEGWYLVKNDRLNVIQESMPPNTQESRHLHHKAQQFFFILEGEAKLEIDGRELTLNAGDGALVPPGVVHRMQNRSRQTLILQVTSQPPSHDDREEAPPK